MQTTLGQVFTWADQNSAAEWSTYQGAVASSNFFQATQWLSSWEPVVWNFSALNQPSSAAQAWSSLAQVVGTSGKPGQAGNGWKPLGGQSVSYSYWWIQNLGALGTRNATLYIR